jgi:hypothetical protein
LVGEVFKARTQVDLDLTNVCRFDRPLGLIKNLGRHRNVLGKTHDHRKARKQTYYLIEEECLIFR